MSFDAYTHLTAWSAFAANGAAVALVIGRPVLTLRTAALAGAAVAAVAMIGSLLYSNVYDLEPCRMCWYQRVAMYPLVPILAIAAWRRQDIRPYALVFAIGGAGVAAWHYAMQHFPSLESACSSLVSCSAPYVWRYGFVSIPYMALSGFVLITLLLWRIREPV